MKGHMKNTGKRDGGRRQKLNTIHKCIKKISVSVDWIREMKVILQRKELYYSRLY